MSENNKLMFFKIIEDNIVNIINDLSKLPVLKFENLDKEKSTLIVINPLNGYMKKGKLCSERLSDIVSPIKDTIKKFKDENMDIIVFSDSHTLKSVELLNQPEHCIKGTEEAEIIDEIKKIGGFKQIEMNSTNAFHVPDFQEHLENNQEKDAFIICGNYTDTCILNFAVTLKTYFDQVDKKVDIYISIDSVETYDYEIHNGELMNILSLQIMLNSGIKLVSNIK